jgi:hypothetical protein
MNMESVLDESKLNIEHSLVIPTGRNGAGDGTKVHEGEFGTGKAGADWPSYRSHTHST